MTKNNKRTFADGSNYSLSRAFSNFAKGGNQVLSAIYFEMMDLGSTCNSTNVRTIADKARSSGSANFSRVRGLINRISDGNVKVHVDDKTDQITIKVKTEMHNGARRIAMDSAALLIVNEYIQRGFAFTNDSLATKLGLNSKGNKPEFDFDKRVKSLIKAAREAGMNDLAIVDGIKALLSETQTDGKPIMDNPSHPATAQAA